MSSIVEEIQERPERASKALEKAKKLEESQINSGYRYIRISPRDVILVECDKDGVPTKRGQAHIDKYKKCGAIKIS